jgi:glycosyltransferase involved in cell wall biosynthesis
LDILIINHNLRDHGTWHRAWNLARELARRDYQITIWTAAPNHYYRSSCESLDGIRIVETPSWAPLANPDDGWGPLDIAWRCLKILRQPFDLCYAFAHPPNVGWPSRLAVLRGKPLLYDWCDWYEGGVFPKRAEMRQAGLMKDEPWFQRRVEKREIAMEHAMIRRAGRITAISRFLVDRCVEHGRSPEDILYLPNGANLDRIQPRDKKECRRLLDLNDHDHSGPYLAYVANYHPDQEMMFRAVSLAAAEHPGLKLVKAGPPFAEGLVEKLNLEHHVVDLGRVGQEQLPVVLGSADALILPLEDNAHNRARTPYKFTDYLSAGRPVVTCAVGDVVASFAETRDKPIGIASDAGAEALGSAIREIFKPGVDLESMGRSARRHAEEKFGWPKLADELETFLQRWPDYPSSSRPRS